MQELKVQRDGLNIRGKIYGDTSEKRPVFILSHGYLANQSMCTKYAKLLADMGFISVTFDFCGGGVISSSDGKSENMTVLTEVEDLTAVVDYISAQDYTDSISLLGCSQGGLVSAMLTKKLKDRIKSLVLMYPALCIPDDARKGKMMLFSFDPNNIPDILCTVPMKISGEYAKTIIDMDPYAEIGGFDGPVLYLHGTADRIVDIEYARKAHVLYPNCRYHEIEGGGHIFRGEANKEACRLLKKFAADLL